ncbi:hypothetical protein Tco_0763445, partial [Tanacetum coccineum]
MRRTLMITLVFRLCEEQVIWNSVLMRLIDDLLALDSIVRFDFSDLRLERTATFSISTNLEYKGLKTKQKRYTKYCSNTRLIGSRILEWLRGSLLLVDPAGVR